MELKKFGFGTISMLAMVLSACTANDDFDEFPGLQEDRDVIGFNVQTSARTRANGSYSRSVAPSGFMVAATDGGNSYFGDGPEEALSPDNGRTWSTRSRRCWPKGRPTNWGGLDFYAYVDDSATYGKESFDMSGDTPGFRDFKVNGDVSRQSDLMYAVSKNVRQDSFSGNVRLNFQHALSQICFTAQNNHPLYDGVEILSIEVGGIKGTGTYTFPENSTYSAFGDMYEPSRGEWAIDTDAPDCTYAIENPGIRLAAPADDCNGEVVNVSKPGDGGDADCVSRTMYLLPQKVDALDTDTGTSGAYIKVTARIISAESPDAGIMERTIPVSVDWKEGQSYVYNISWDAYPITYSVSVDSYNDVNVTMH